MIKEFELTLLPEQAFDDAHIKNEVAKKLQVNIEQITAIDKIRRSIDARSKFPVYKLSVISYVNEKMPEAEFKIEYNELPNNAPKVIIVGFGPAGMFAALRAIELGIKPIVFERGKDVRSRRRDLKNIQQESIVDPDSNYCFGEGGAGTYSDGKLYTRSSKRGDVKKMLRILHQHGAIADILIDARPHIGSDKLPKVVESIRQTILSCGGEIHFSSRVTDLLIIDNVTRGVVVNNESEHIAEAVILATGHSARDIYELLQNKNVAIEAKEFAMGVRIEHPQSLIDKIQYHCSSRNKFLPPAYYNFVLQVEERGIYSFCMCPGGLVIPASTSQEELVLNGMSTSGRNFEFANAGFVSEIKAEDWTEFSHYKELAAMKYQQKLEKSIWQVTHSQKAPAQKVVDFVEGRISQDLNKTSYIPGVTTAPLYELLPKKIVVGLRTALLQLDKKMKGFYSNEGQMLAAETRTSSPVRMLRQKENLMSLNIKGLFPSGEGAGYAGGIISAAIDGENSMNAAVKYLIS